MKYIINAIKGFIIGIWLIFAIFSTICLIQFNEFGVTQFGNTSFIIINNNELKPFEIYDLAIINKEKSEMYKEGEYIFFYLDNNYSDKVNFGQITAVQTDEYASTAYYVGDAKIDYNKVIGHANGAKVYHKVGLILNIFESRWGFMFLVILPTLYAVVYEIYSIIVEAKKEARREEKRLAKGYSDEDEED